MGKPGDFERQRAPVVNSGLKKNLSLQAALAEMALVEEREFDSIGSRVENRQGISLAMMQYRYRLTSHLNLVEKAEIK